MSEAAHPLMVMNVVEPVKGEEEKELSRLTVKDKMLLQIGEHLCEPDLAEFPFELTQKGLSEHLGTRRSHIAASMKGLVEEKLVEQYKGHIEGETRQQNAYVLTPKGRERASELKDRILRIEVEFEKDGEVQTLPIGDILKTTSLSLASVINQIAHGGPVGDETTLVTKPGRQLIPVFCPTCKKNFEVENIYADEEVGFDCPGCGRPYRIVPAKKEIRDENKAEIGATRAQLAVVALTMILGMIAIEIHALAPDLIVNVFFVTTFIAISVALFLGYFVTWKKARHIRRKSTLGGGIIAAMLLFGLILVQMWDHLVISIDFQRETAVSLVIAAAALLGYIGAPATPVQTRGEYLLVVGLFMVMISAVLPFSRNIEGLTMASVPFLGIIGMTAVLLSTFHYVDRETQILDLILAAGIVIAFVSFVQLFPERRNLLDDIELASLVLLGMFMASLRFVQMKATVNVGDQFIASAALSTGLLFAVLGAFMIWGDSPVAGLVEILLVVPFIYYAVRKVFSGEWMYRVPIVSYMGFVEALVLIDVLLT